MLESKTLVVAGGGTGGHVLAGIAAAQAWRERFGAAAPVFFIGSSGGIEEKLVGRAGYPLDLISIGSLNRVSWRKRFKTLFQLPWSLVRSASLILKHRPDAVLGVGGYASGPVVLTARVLRGLGLSRGRTAILEPNAVPGMTNRLLSRFSDRIFCAFPGMQTYFPSYKIVVTGSPVRAEFSPLPHERGLKFVVFIFGGSQGALGVNTLVIDALAALGDLKQQLRFVHQTGEKDFERVSAAYREAGCDARVERFIHDMVTVYREASLVVCRAGSSTLAELAAVGRAAVLVPLPTAADNHQEKNARVYSDAGAAVMLIQAKSKGADLARVVRELLKEPSRLGAMEKAVAAFYRPQAAQDIAGAMI